MKNTLAKFRGEEKGEGNKYIRRVNSSRDKKREKRGGGGRGRVGSGPRRSDTRNQFRRCRYFEPLFTIESNSTG